MQVFQNMIGRKMVRVERIGGRGRYDNDALEFEAEDGTVFAFSHQQDCCESVYIDDIVGDLNDLVGATLTMAEEIDADGPDTGAESETWTFYKFATIKGYVTVKFYGSSNGYYSEGVSYFENSKVQYRW